MSYLQLFCHEKFKDLLLFEFQNKIYFNPDDIALTLNYNSSKSMLQIMENIPQEYANLYIKHFSYQILAKLHLKDEVRNIIWSRQGKRFLTEIGLFYLLAKSEKPNAYAYQTWILTEILPLITLNIFLLQQELKQIKTLLAAQENNK